MIGRLVLAALVALSIAGCTAPGSQLPPIEVKTLEPYRLDGGDEVRVTVFDLESLSNTYTVSDAGTISMPLLDSVEAAEKTTAELKATIERRLRNEKIITDPSVSVQVQEYRPFFILGEVRDPGKYPYIPGMTALTAVSIAGGFTFRAQTGYIAITRMRTGEIVEGKAEVTAPVLPGDTIRVFESWF